MPLEARDDFIREFESTYEKFIVGIGFRVEIVVSLIVMLVSFIGIGGSLIGIGFSVNGFSVNGFSVNGFSVNGFSVNGF